MSAVKDSAGTIAAASPTGGASRVLHVDLGTGLSRVFLLEDRTAHLGGSGLAAALYRRYGDAAADALAPEQPIIFAIGPLTGYYPLMSKTVCGFRSPYTGQWAESHAGGRLALSLRFAGYDALMITGRAPTLSALLVGSREVETHDVHYLRGADVFTAGKYLRRFGSGAAGHRSTLRVGPAAENGVAYGCINVDSYRHFGRLGAGTALAAKNIKGIVVMGDSGLALPQGREYAALFKDIHHLVTATPLMKKYHDLGTPENLLPLNELKAMPWRNLQATTDPGAYAISGEYLAQNLLLRQAACAGCPVGCIHIALLRQQFGSEHEFVYKQVAYDHETVFAEGSMLGNLNAADMLAVLDEVEKTGMDAMSAGVALAWATEALERGLVSEKETLLPLTFGGGDDYVRAVRHLAAGSNEFWRALGQGVEHAARLYGGFDFACSLGQEMAGYATGEVFFVSQAMGFRHSHLDSGGYSFDQSPEAGSKDIDAAVAYLLRDEEARVTLTCMVACLFGRKAYTPDKLREALRAAGFAAEADALEQSGRDVRALRWQLKFATGFDPARIEIPRRFSEVETWKGPIDAEYMNRLKEAYARTVAGLTITEDTA